MPQASQGPPQPMPGMSQAFYDRMSAQNAFPSSSTAGAGGFKANMPFESNYGFSEAAPAMSPLDSQNMYGFPKPPNGLAGMAPSAFDQFQARPMDPFQPQPYQFPTPFSACAPGMQTSGMPGVVPNATMHQFPNPNAQIVQMFGGNMRRAPSPFGF